MKSSGIMKGKIIMPIGFSMMENGLYRSSYPVSGSFPYLQNLNLKTIISVDGRSARSELLDFIEKNEIQLIAHEVGANQEPFQVMDIGVVSQVIAAAMDVRNQPCLIYSSTEKVGLSVVCACIRKLKGWPLTSVMKEFELFAQPEATYLHLISVMESLITVIIVTSPVRSNPDTYLIDTVLKSLSYVDGMRTCPVLILLDHYILADTARPKSGKITSDMAASYDEYYAALLQQYLCPQYRIVKSDVHLGFAMSVKWGLEMCTTEYAMIIQHDRSFSRPFSHVENALRVFAEHSHVRYIGFTTSSSVNHENTIAERYRLKDLVEQHNYIRFTDEFILKPLIFWYDSTHFCHVRRYLEIYSPFKNIPAELKNIFGGNSSVKEMILRNGDFIEDRFGQAQRHILTSLREKPVDLLTAFRWFGSYLICDNYTYTDRNCKSMESAIKKQTIFVHHLRGRTYDPAVEDRYNITGAAECPGGSIASHHEENAIEENSSHTDEEIRACSQLYNAHTFV